MSDCADGGHALNMKWPPTKTQLDQQLSSLPAENYSLTSCALVA